MGYVEQLMGVYFTGDQAKMLAAGMEQSQSSVSAAGTTLSDATLISKPFTIVSTVAAGAGVRLDGNLVGAPVRIKNSGASTLKVYPPTSSGAINGGSAGAAFEVPPGKSLTIFAGSATAFYASLLEDTPGLSKVSAGLTAAGSTIADALDVTRPIITVTTTASSTGIQLGANLIGELVLVSNLGANALSIYPPDGSSTINGGSAGAAFSLASTKSALLFATSATAWRAITID